jgi:hypothetical protein
MANTSFDPSLCRAARRSRSEVAPGLTLTGFLCFTFPSKDWSNASSQRKSARIKLCGINHLIMLIITTVSFPRMMLSDSVGGNFDLVL